MSIFGKAAKCEVAKLASAYGKVCSSYDNTYITDKIKLGGMDARCMRTVIVALGLAKACGVCGLITLKMSVADKHREC